MKRVFIIHGWGGYPEENWFPWLKKELEAKGFKVYIPQMPDAANPRIQNWVPAISKVVAKLDEGTYFVGHSMGCQAIARYLESLPSKIKAGGAIFVAGFFKRLTGIEKDDKETERHWLTTSINLDKTKEHLTQSVAIFSDNDPFVPLDNQDDFKEKLGSKIIVEHDKGHFNLEKGVRELPIVLNELLKMARK